MQTGSQRSLVPQKIGHFPQKFFLHRQGQRFFTLLTSKVWVISFYGHINYLITFSNFPSQKCLKISVAEPEPPGAALFPWSRSRPERAAQAPSP